MLYTLMYLFSMTWQDIMHELNSVFPLCYRTKKVDDFTSKLLDIHSKMLEINKKEVWLESSSIFNFVVSVTSIALISCTCISVQCYCIWLLLLGITMKLRLGGSRETNQLLWNSIPTLFILTSNYFLS